jgi:hypothetical protein
MWKEFKFSLKRSMTVGMIALVLFMVAIVNIALGVLLNALYTSYPEIVNEMITSLAKAGLTASGMANMVYWVFFLFLLVSVIRGVLSSSFGFLFTKVDENLISASPVAPHSLYVAKKFKRLMIHSMEVGVLLLAVLPFVSRIGFNGILLGLLFISLLATIEFYGLTENSFHCLSRALVMREGRLKLVPLVGIIALLSFCVVIPLLAIVGVNLGSINALLYFYPPYSLSRILLLSNQFNMSEGVISIALATILFFILAASSAGYGLKRWSSSPSFAQSRGRYFQLRKNELGWKTGSKNQVNLVVRKDFWVTVRNPSRFLIPLAIELAIVIFSVQLQLFFPFPQLQVMDIQSREEIYFLAVYLLAVFILPPAWDSFASERRTIYLLKTAPIDPDDVIKGKYLFALLKSLTYLAPIVIALSFIVPHVLDFSVALLEAVLILLVSNGVGILASVSYPPAYRGIGPPPLLIVISLPLVSALLTVIIPLSFMTYYTNLALFAFLSVAMIFYSYGLLRFFIKRATNSFLRLLET